MRRRVVVIGRTRLAVECLQTVVDAGDEVALVLVDAGDDGTDGWQPSLRRAAGGMGLSVEAPVDVNHRDFVERMERMDPHFLLSFQAAPILRQQLIGTARVAALNLHFGLLPRYRGMSPIAWSVINGETATGVTLHVIEPGVDSGPIVCADEVPIGPDDTARSVYDRCTDAGIELFSRAWPEIRSRETVTGTPQDSSAALYYNRHAIDFSRRRVDWHADAAVVANWMRGFIFPPFQYPEIGHDDTIFQVTSVALDREPHRGRPGEVLATDGETLIVAAPGGRVTLRSLQLDGQPLDAAALEAAGLVAGARLT